MMMMKHLLIVASYLYIAESSVSKNKIYGSSPLQFDKKTCMEYEFCSPWHYCHEGECKLGELPPYDILRYDGKHISVLDNTCVTYNYKENIMEAGHCIYNFIHGQKSHKAYYQLQRDIFELNQVMCGEHFNRTGTLCAMCADDTYPLVYSYQMICVSCPNGKSNWWKFILAAFLPLTVFYFIALSLKINITSSSLFGFVYVVQIISHPELIRLSFVHFQGSFLLGLRVLTELSGIWNLDFFRSTYEICLGTDTLTTMALDLAIAVYPLLLMIISYLLIILYDRNFRLFVLIVKPFRIITNCFHANWDIRTSTIDVFATFFLLSNVKFLSISYGLLTPVRVYQLNSTGSLTHSWRVFFDPTVLYLSNQHLFYAIPALLSLLFFVLMPVLILALYPFKWFQKLLNLFPFRWYILHTFVDSFQGCYKDGTVEGTQDYRWFPSLFFLVRMILYILASFILSLAFFTFSIFAIVILLILLVTVQPFKENVRHYYAFNSCLLLMMSIFLLDLIGIQMSKIWGTQVMLSALKIFLILISIISHLYAFTFIAHCTGVRRCWNCIIVPIRRMQAWRRGYHML